MNKITKTIENELSSQEEHADSPENMEQQAEEKNEITCNEEEDISTPPPLISCIMPTANRPEYVARSVQMFMEQDYPNKELIIVYNRPADLPSEWYTMLAADFPENIRVVQAMTKVIGAKRNEACRHAQGAIIAHWDDDDIYNTDRLSMQAAPILNGQADITGLQNFVFFEADAGRSWQPSRLRFRDLYEGNIHGGSLVYNSMIWHGIANYSNLSLGEDAVFLKKVMKSPYNIRLMPLNGMNSFVYVRHNNNAWHVDEEIFTGSEWTQVGLPKWAWEYAPFYEEMARAAVYAR